MVPPLLRGSYSSWQRRLHGGAHVHSLLDPSIEGEGAPVMVAPRDHQPDDGVALSHIGGVA